MGTTARLALPYPELSDSADVPRDVRALADKLDGFTSMQPPVVTNLPGSPVDGQEVYYQVGPNNLWHFRYSAAAGTYKWQFLGGPDIGTDSTGTDSMNTGGTGTWAVAPNAPKQAVPLKGLYQARLTPAYAQLQTTGGIAECRISLAVDGVRQGHPNGGIVATQFEVTPLTLDNGIDATAAGHVVTVYAATTAAKTFTLWALGARLWIRPIAVG